MVKHARWRLVARTGNAIIIKDMGPHSQHLTITNDVEWVVNDVQLRYIHLVLTPKQRLFYIDSHLRMDEILLEWNGEGSFAKFVGFRSLLSPERQLEFEQQCRQTQEHLRMHCSGNCGWTP